MSNLSLSGNTTRTTDWYATFNNVPASGVQNLKVYYTGRNRRILQPTSGWTPGCTQTVRIWNWTTNNWNTPSLDSQTVGGTDVAIPDPVPSAPDSKYVEGDLTAYPEWNLKIMLSPEFTSGEERLTPSEVIVSRGQ